MDIDQRLEALTQTVELIAGMMRDNEARNEARMSTIDTRLGNILTAIERDAENIRGLAVIASAHEQRLSDLEGGAR